VTGDDHGIMETLTDLLARDRPIGRPALSAPGDPAREYDYRRLRTDAGEEVGERLHDPRGRRRSRADCPRAVAVV
jgi:hypothetical protein